MCKFLSVRLRRGAIAMLAAFALVASGMSIWSVVRTHLAPAPSIRATIDTSVTAASLLEKARNRLARLDGEMAVPGLRASVEVLRDRWGVPHIEAHNTHDLFVAQGFVIAQDRLFQLELWRRTNAGLTAEILGRQGLPIDRFARLLRFRGDLGAEWASYSTDAHEIVTAFTEGINAWIDETTGHLPIEFDVLDIQPSKWQPEDCLGRMTALEVTRNLYPEIIRARLVAVVGAENAHRLAPTDPPIAYAPAPGFDLTGIDFSVLADYFTAQQPLIFSGTAQGSNNWVVDGSRSQSGKPLLANDPHRSLMLPSLRYIVHLRAPGWNVIGSGEPGLPGVAVGHNDRVAWGFTVVGTDQADLYVEETDPNRPGEYRVGTNWEPMTIVHERIRVRGERDPVELELRFTRHGPVLHEDASRHRAFALKWVGSEPGAAPYLAALAINRARNAREFQDGLRRWLLPSENMVFADVDGAIGWVAAGLAPIRRGWDGLLPIPGADGAYEWQGFLPTSDLPHLLNPESHWIATANNNILPPGYKPFISADWDPGYRYQRIRSQLAKDRKWGLSDFQRMQLDTVSLPHQSLARLARAMKHLETIVSPEIRRLIVDWDGDLARTSGAAALYETWLDELRDEFFPRHVSRQAVDFAYWIGAVPELLGALHNPDRAWFGNNPTQARDQLLERALIRAVKRLERALGSDPGQWQWGRLHTATFRHPCTGLGPSFSEAFNCQPLPRPGDNWTVNATTPDRSYRQTAGATYRQLFDLADWDRGLAINAPGQSGQPGSPHYADLLPLWAEGQYFPLAFSREKIEEVTRHRLHLKPASQPIR